MRAAAWPSAPAWTIWAATTVWFSCVCSRQQAASTSTTPPSVGDVEDAPVIELSEKVVGWLGPYHPSVGQTWAAPGVKNGTGVWNAFHFGTVCVENAVSDGGFKLEDDLSAHCEDWDVNSVYGMLLPPSEGGTFNNPNDTSLYAPLSPAGLVQGAARWSRLAAKCPQIAGVQIDDFLQNYVGTRPYTPPPPLNYTGCVKCPHGAHMYGSATAGAYCCNVEAAGHCPPHEGECCLAPGTTSGCQGVASCGNNPHNHTACGVKPPHAMLTLENMRDIKAALLGKTVDPLTGEVDHSSVAKTPYLKLFICWYTHETAQYQWLRGDGLLNLVDGVNIWIWEQTTPDPGYTAAVADVRKLIGPDVEMMAAAYLLNSGPCDDWCNIEGFDKILQEAITLYDRGELVGMYLFAGEMLAASYMNETMWKRWALPAKLQAEYYPYLGDVEVTVMDSSTGKKLEGATVHVTYGAMDRGGAFVTHKHTSGNGTMKFGGWAGKAKPTKHLLRVSLAGYADAKELVQVKAQGKLEVAIKLRSN